MKYLFERSSRVTTKGAGRTTHLVQSSAVALQQHVFAFYSVRVVPLGSSESGSIVWIDYHLAPGYFPSVHMLP
jgi:hypothetical protein